MRARALLICAPLLLVIGCGDPEPEASPRPGVVDTMPPPPVLDAPPPPVVDPPETVGVDTLRGVQR
jgi:hypothetical protein